MTKKKKNTQTPRSRASGCGCVLFVSCSSTCLRRPYFEAEEADHAAPQSSWQASEEPQESGWLLPSFPFAAFAGFGSAAPTSGAVPDAEEEDVSEAQTAVSSMQLVRIEAQTEGMLRCPQTSTLRIVFEMCSSCLASNKLLCSWDPKPTRSN